jgi:epoxyqueuosine reductase
LKSACRSSPCLAQGSAPRPQRDDEARNRACPWNSFAEPTGEAAFLPREGIDGASLIQLMGMSQEEFSSRFKGSPVKQTKRRGLLRNEAVALGNWGSPEGMPVLAAALNDEEPLVRGHAAWALGQIGTEAARQVLRGRDEVEWDAWVREEIAAALVHW